ncbi:MULTISPECIES: hypothetical protein [Pseudomonas]|uniref:hypothetical protein n=1 Tax=Pseudomonas TaxID=286 RepID=UPI001E300489|nr:MULTISPECIES: hypothetical protein [Pseudomonas]MCE1118742.1 hypothetical protein [Pseudomonas sp. NMI795_08]
MLKIVPDPPHSPDIPQYLEDTLVEAMEHALCGLAVAHQSITYLPRSPATIMLMTVMHELDALRTLVECALAQLQRRAHPSEHTLH